MTRWMAISAYTVNTPYEQEVKTLEASLQKFKVPYKLYPFESRGSWHENCVYNSVIIQHAFEELNRNLVWLDSDAEVFAYPSLFDSYPYDIGLYRRMHTIEQVDITGKFSHWDTGTMFLKNTKPVRDFLWSINKSMRVPVGENDSWIMKRFNDEVDAVISGKSDFKLRIGTFPVTYSYIFDTKQREETRHKHSVVIQHNQASRRFKDKI